MSKEVLSYRVKPGRTFGDFFEFGPGSIVKLTEAQASGFLDKLELVGHEADAISPESELSHLRRLTVGQLQGFPEWQFVPAPKPTVKAEIISAILAVRHPDDENEPAGAAVDFNNELVLNSMTVAELKALPEWENVPDPKPTVKAEIINAILAAREAV